jgi:nuclear RNA export factor
LSWEGWLNCGSRNLSRLINFDKIVATLQGSSKEIVELFEKLPKTRHEIGDAQKFIVDSWPIYNVLAGENEQSIALYIGVHGQFTEGMFIGNGSVQLEFNSGRHSSTCRRYFII